MSDAFHDADDSKKMPPLIDLAQKKMSILEVVHMMTDSEISWEIAKALGLHPYRDAHGLPTYRAPGTKRPTAIDLYPRFWHKAGPLLEKMRVFAPGLLSDDAESWTVTFGGTQPVPPEPFGDFTYFVDRDDCRWCDSPMRAICEAFLVAALERGNVDFDDPDPGIDAEPTDDDTG